VARSAANTVSPRRIVAGVFVFVGLFLGFFGIGNRSLSLFVAGAAVVVLSFGVRVFSSFRRTPRQWLLGTGHITGVSDVPPVDSRFGRCEMQLIIDAPGMPTDPVTVVDPRVPVAAWPSPGLDVPIEVAADDPHSVRIQWKQLAAGDGLFDYAEAEEAGPEAFAEQAAPAQAGPAAAPEWIIDFDLDSPPAASEGSRPGLPPDLGMVPVPAATAAGMPTAAGPATAAGEDGSPPEVPRQKPRPYPHPSRVSAPSEPPPEATPEPPPAASPPPPPERPRRPPRQPTPEPAPPPAPPSQPTRQPAMAGASTGGAPRGRRSTSLVDDPVPTVPSAQPAAAGAISGVGITVLVADLDRSIAFYRDQLGFYEVDGGDGNTVLASGETRLVLRATPNLPTVTQRSVYLNLEVSDIDAVHTELRANGVKFIDAPHPVNRTARLEQWAAVFRDPDGHGIALSQWRPAPDST
jgi:catechol 2,3-dioxygenase-like lactoylglutathione lyase family enzyme